MARAWADVSLDAVAANVAALVEHVAPAAVCAVVKADGYGHGAVPVARRGGRGGRDVAGGRPGAGGDRAARGGDRRAGAAAVGAAARRGGRGARRRRRGHPLQPRPHRAGRRGGRPTGWDVDVRAPEGGHRDAPGRRRTRRGRGAAREQVRVAPRPVARCRVDPLRGRRRARPAGDRGAAGERYEAALAAVEAAGIPVGLRHAANSAAALVHPASRYDLVRCGIAVYGIPPAPALAGVVPLAPVVRLATEVSFVKPVAAGRGHLLRPPVPHRPRHRSSPPSRSATPTACSVGSGSSARRC